MDDQELVQGLVAALQSRLLDVPFVVKLEAVELPKGLGPDWVGKLHTKDGTTRLVVLEANRNGQPRVIRRAEMMLDRWDARYPDAIRIVGAKYINANAAELAAQKGLSFVDLSGNCRLATDRIYVRREGWTNKYAEHRDLRSFYSPKAERMLRVMLNQPRRGWRIEELADVAQISLGMASYVKKLLDQREWMEKQPGGLVLSHPARLLVEWGENYDFSRNIVREYFTLEASALIEQKLAQVTGELASQYSLTAFSAAAKLVPRLRHQRVTAYVTGDVAETARRIGLQPVTGSANVSLIEPHDEGVLAGVQEVLGLRMVSTVQTYLDLQGFKGRGQEAAQIILDEVIKRTW